MSYVSVAARAAGLLIGVLAALAGFGRPAAAAEALEPIAPQDFFVSPDRPAVLRWRTRDELTGGGLAYVIRDYGGRVAAEGRAKAAGRRAAEAAVTLRPGFYEIEFARLGRRFGVVALPAYEGGRDPFFAIDAAMSWLVGDDRVREGLIAVLARCGVAMARERLRWASINPAPGRWDWEADRRYETLRRTYARYGVEVLEMFHDSPQWLGHVARYPADLARTARQWEEAARRWGALWGALETWNEPDIFFGGDLPADQYVPLVQSVTAGVGRGGFRGPVVGGVFAHFDQRYLDTAAANGLLEAIDALSFHTYGRAPQLEGLAARYRGWLERQGRGRMPLWLTECGRPWRRGPGRPPQDEDAASALDITMKVVEARACGVARHFPFVYPYYEERENNFGMMGRAATPLRSMAAYAQAVRRLANKDYLGDLKTDDPAIQRARVFGDRREKVAVIYTGVVDADRRVRLGVRPLRVEGIDGRALAAGPDEAVPVPDGMAYVWLDPGRLAGRLQPETPAMRLWRLGRNAEPRPREASPPVVLRLDLQPDVWKADAHGYRLAGDRAALAPLEVRVFNLDEQPHAVRLALPAQARPAEGWAEAAARLAPGGSAVVAWRVDLRLALKTDGWTTLHIAAACDDQPLRGLTLAMASGAAP